jgi:hydroxypyruvate isomerase
MKLSAHLSTLYGELPFTERITAAAADGFEWVEFWDLEASSLSAVASRLTSSRLRVAVVNVPAGWEQDDCGRMCDPAAVEWWRDQFSETLLLARMLGARSINLLAGRSTGDRDEHHRVLAENLGWALERVGNSDLNLLLEPLNADDRPGYLLSTCAEALAVRDLVPDGGRVGLLFDVYHAHKSGTDPAWALIRHPEAIFHVQVADSPGRHEPGTGEIDFGRVFEELSLRHYDGLLGLEYLPSCGHGAALAWREQFASHFDAGLTHSYGRAVP